MSPGRRSPDEHGEPAFSGCPFGVGHNRTASRAESVYWSADRAAEATDVPSGELGTHFLAWRDRLAAIVHKPLRPARDRGHRTPPTQGIGLAVGQVTR